MSLSRFVRRRTADADSNTARLARAAGREVSVVETLESRVLLAADWSGAMTPDLAFGPEYKPGSGIEQVAWRGVGVEAVERSWVLTFDDAYGKEQAELFALEAAAATGQRVESVTSLGRGRWAEITFEQTPSDWAIQRAGEFSWLKAFEPNALSREQRLPDDTGFGSQWQFDNTGQAIGGQVGTIGADVNALAAWDITIGSHSVIVGVVDSGIDFDHPDLRANIWTNPGEIADNGIDDDGNGFIDDVNGWNFADGNNDAQDLPSDGHGTFVSGLIGAAGNNGIGITGVAWNVSILPIKASTDGLFTLDALVSSHDYLTMMIETYGHNIVATNASYGGINDTFYADAPQGFDAERDAISRFLDTGAAFVAAAGNDAFDLDNPNFTAFPASYNLPGLMSVAATDNQDTLAGFSNWGAQRVDFAAPGDLVYSTVVGGAYGFGSGTSFSAPIVTGTVALLKALRPNASATEIRQALIDGSDILPSLQGRVVSGGRINIERSLRIIGTDGPIAIGFNPGPVTARIDADTGLPIDTVTVTFNKDLDGTTLDSSAALFTFAGPTGCTTPPMTTAR